MLERNRVRLVSAVVLALLPSTILLNGQEKATSDKPLDVSVVLNERRRVKTDFAHVATVTMHNSRNRPVWCVIPMDADQNAPAGDLAVKLWPGLLGGPISVDRYTGRGESHKAVTIVSISGERGAQSCHAVLVPPHGTIEIRKFRFFVAPKDVSQIQVGEASETLANGKIPLQEWVGDGCLSEDGAVLALETEMLKLHGKRIWGLGAARNRPERPEPESIILKQFRPILVKTTKASDYTTEEDAPDVQR